MTNAVFVLGGGRMGLVAARDLAESEDVDQVIVGDVDLSKAEKLARDIGSRKVSVVKADATNHANLVSAISGSKVLINAVWYEFNLAVMRAAIEARVHYNDLGGLFHMTRQQMRLDTDARRAGVTAVLGGGESPGVSNVMCAASAEKMDIVEAIRVRAGGREESQSVGDKLVFPFSVSTVFDEYSKPPIMFIDGQFKEVAPLSGEEEIEFPQPVGKNRCHYTIHSEMATLPFSYKGVRDVDFKLGISEKIFKVIKPLLDAGLADTSPIRVKGQNVIPRDFAISYLNSRSSDEEPRRYVALRTEVFGVKRGKKVLETRTVIGEPSERFQVKNATGLLTGIAASIIAQFIMAGKIAERGAVAPEACVPTGPFFEELKRRGVRMEASELVIPS